MGRYRKILVAADGSESGKNAFRQACKIVRDEKSWLTVITAIPVYHDQFEVLSTREKVTSRLKDEGEKILSAIKEIAAEEDVFIKTRVEEGAPFDTIIDVAEEGNYDLIVMGRHGKSRLEKSLVGSVTSRVIGHSQRDILVIPHTAAIAWHRIMLPTDGSRYSLAAADKAIDIAKSYGGDLFIVSVVDVTEEFYTESPGTVEQLIRKARDFVKDLKERAESNGLKAEALIREGDTFKLITSLSKEHNCDVIVMGSHGRTGIKRLLMGSTAEKVIGYASCPILIAKS